MSIVLDHGRIVWSVRPQIAAATPHTYDSLIGQAQREQHKEDLLDPYANVSCEDATEKAWHKEECAVPQRQAARVCGLLRQHRGGSVSGRPDKRALSRSHPSDLCRDIGE